MESTRPDSRPPASSVVWPAKINHVPKEIFVSNELFEEELKRIFYGEEWHAVAHEGEIPNIGDFKTFRHARVPLLITRAEDGSINVMYNACSHRGSQVETKPHGNKLEFECPYHRWLFDAKGSLVGCPAKPGDFSDTFRKEDYPLACPRVAVVHGLIFITLSDKTPPIEEWMAGWTEQLGEVLGGDGRLRLLGYQKVVFRSNWKIYHDNDAYHAPLLHQAFRMLNWQGGKGVQRADERGHRGFRSELSLPRAQTLLKDASLIQYMNNEKSSGLSVSVHLFPAAVSISHLNSIGIRFMSPISVDETEVHYAYFAHADDDEALVRHRVRQSSNLLGPCGLVSMEDASVFHRLYTGSHTPGNAVFQKGVGDEYTMPVEFSQNDESANLPGWEHYRKIMGLKQEEK
ncbi:MAG: aromatic ring-hydroxylating dioxygenase subunit alpha [Pigmentiphaga sp.]|nr:aromatic ring-hydroxylating dioxygenase subunit alpha [Pigmentiphaga sp.]